MELNPERPPNDVEMRELDEDDVQDDDEDEDPVGCVTCGEDFPTMQAYVVHACASSSDLANRGRASHELREEDPMDLGVGGEGTNSSDHGESFASLPTNSHDAESFIGKIVYNPDGSAYVIEGGDSDDADLDLLDVPKLEGAIVDRHGAGRMASPAPPIPQIASAVFVPRPSSAWCRAINNVYPDSCGAQPDGAPTMHSFRVYNVRSPPGGLEGGGGRNDVESEQKPRLPAKPILMCFICKLSFGLPLSFVSHARDEHALELNEEERTILARPKASAILQGVGKEKTPLMSFLEPLHSPSSSQPGPASGSSALTPVSFFQPSRASTPTPKAASAATKVKYMYTSPRVSQDVARGPSSGNQEPASEDASSKPTSEPWLPWASESSGKSLRDDEQKGVERDEARPHSMSLDSFGSRRGGGGGGRDGGEGGPVTTIPYHPSPAAVTSDNGNVSVKLEPSLTPSFSAPQDLSPQDYVPSASTPVSLFSASQLSLLAGGTCDEHPLGRVQGTECPKCDMVLGSSQSLGGHMTMMHSRNSCKTLKCPKCNWHYKYQETLEIHMKEKHPDNDAQCMYCLTNQAHPRLARGETYSCGYKPYRCNACNYSTTTKGNLSIHMQSDKHMNNVQELANGGSDMSVNQAPNHSQGQPKGPYSAAAAAAAAAVAGEDPLKKLKPKQSWRCDVCNYETLVARNLRIHMTSEKHTHNMMVLQQNMKHMQRDMQLQMGQLMLMGQQDPIFSLPPGGLAPSLYPPYEQSLMVGGGPPLYDLAISLGRAENGAVGDECGPGSEASDASLLFQCTVCELHATDSLDSLHQHLNLDRTKQRESENISVQGGTYTCHMCQYKTGLKANFQLHCKTDKHLQKLQMTNHIREGGPANEWRLTYLGASNPAQVRCNACGFYTSSVHKLQLHATQLSHENNAHVFRLLQMALARLQSSSATPVSRYYYRCVLCACNTRTKQAMVRHAMSMKHLQQAQTKQLTLDPRDVYVAVLLREGDSVVFDESGKSRQPSLLASLAPPTYGLPSHRPTGSGCWNRAVLCTCCPEVVDRKFKSNY